MSLVPEPQPLWRTLKETGSSPTSLLEQFRIRDPAVDVAGIAGQMGIHLHEVSEPGWSGAVKSSKVRADIWVRKEDVSVRKRFTIAHELGHLMLDPLGMEFRDGNFDGGPRETRANRFAADLLMPLWMLHQEAQIHRGDVKVLAQRFDVSEQAMKIRLALL